MSLIYKYQSVTPTKQRGFSLLEILVTVIILSIGLLGLAGLQAAALRYSSTAYQRSQATALAYEIVDEMRANAKAARCGAYTGGTSKSGEDCTNTAVPDLNARVGFAKAYVKNWETALANTLPAGKGVISYNGNLIRVAISWDDSRGEEAVRDFSMETEL